METNSIIMNEKNVICLKDFNLAEYKEKNPLVFSPDLWRVHILETDAGSYGMSRSIVAIESKGDKSFMCDDDGVMYDGSRLLMEDKEAILREWDVKRFVTFDDSDNITEWLGVVAYETKRLDMVELKCILHIRSFGERDDRILVRTACSSQKVIMDVSKSEMKMLMDKIGESGLVDKDKILSGIRIRYGIHEFKIFDKVLVRGIDTVWFPRFFGRRDGKSFVDTNGCHWSYCIPYEGNEELAYTDKEER